MAAAGGEQEDPELLARIGVVREGIYRRMKLLASWADLDDDQVFVHLSSFFSPSFSVSVEAPSGCVLNVYCEGPVWCR